MEEKKAPATFELLLKDWADWKMDGSRGPLSYPSAAPYARNMGGGQCDYVPDVDRALLCMAVQDAINAVGGIHQGVIEAAYFWPGKVGTQRIMDKYRISRPTVYRWLDDARWWVWVEFERAQKEKQNAA